MSTKRIVFRKGNRVVAYIRVSDESQVRGHSLEAQKREIERWCQQRGYVLVKVYVEAGVSAHTDQIEKRPELVQLLRDGEMGQFDIVVVHTLDRWARKLSIQLQALGQLAKAGVGFASVNDPFDATTPQGRLMLNQMGSYNEFFSELLAIHVRKAFHLKAEMGLTVGPVPFAYRREGEAKDTPPAKIEREAKAVEESFHLRDEGSPYSVIAAWLNAQGFRTREGHAFTAHAVKDMLSNRFYCGYVKYKGEEFKGKHEPIISEELFQRVQDRKQRRDYTRSVNGPRGLLQGMVYCLRCGNSIQSDRHRGQVPLYRERHAHDCTTNNTSSVAGVFDRQMATIIHSLGLHPDWRQRMAELATAEYKGPDPAALQEKRRRLARAYYDGAFSDEEYNWKLAEIDRRLQQANTVTSPAIEEAATLFSDIPMLWMEATPEERRQLISPLVERVYVDLETKRIGAIAPAPAFRPLLSAAIEVAPEARVRLVASEEELKDMVGDGGDGGESNSPSNEGSPTAATGLVDSFMSPRRPLSTEFGKASRSFLWQPASASGLPHPG